jgi:hypothetical protein
MRDYQINTDKLVNQLVPHYLGGRRIILFLQSLLQPLKTLNQTWKEWADEKRIEAALTSQVIMMEYFLNRKFKKYFANASQQIVISDGEINGTPMYWQSTNSIDDVILYNASEGKEATTFKWENEKLASSDYSFIVNCPAVNTSLVSETEFTAMVSYYIEKYRIAGKTFKIIYL